MRWLWRLAALFLAVGALDIAVLLLVPHPFPWVAIVPALVPVFTVVFIVIPMTRAQRT